MSDTPGIQLPTIAVLGAGSMGGAVLHGLLQPTVEVLGGIRVTTRSGRRTEFAGRSGVRVLSLREDPDANRRAVAGAALVLVAVKPVGVLDLLQEIAGSLAPGTLVVSVAAGVSTAAMERRLPDDVAVIRAMPNTPATVRLAVTGISAGSRASAEQRELARNLFGTVGSVLEVDEDRLDALSAISGSGPAYVFYLVEQLEAAARERGFDDEEANLLVQGTFRGAVELLASSGLSPAELRRRVTSPNGTTERAIAVLEEARLADTFDVATAAALARARQLAAELA
ncbi:MAG: pyrroline-5-carboxylate reductase [Naasia sp.]|uniref:pyrroline-5-carboxylate reductase n=1 Tax=Naasia sp. TaxID=2546198 RepID=UPI00260DCCB7|nr:pyrroline-5-carboxylate reductase [Naasia sp.]MCU1570636.1 pyrroline-5-carboxylate reductase [Naasia sp.]